MSSTAYNIVVDYYQIKTYVDRGSWANFPVLSLGTLFQLLS